MVVFWSLIHSTGNLLDLFAMNPPVAPVLKCVNLINKTCKLFLKMDVVVFLGLRLLSGMDKLWK